MQHWAMFLDHPGDVALVIVVFMPGVFVGFMLSFIRQCSWWAYKNDVEQSRSEAAMCSLVLDTRLANERVDVKSRVPFNHVQVQDLFVSDSGLKIHASPSCSGMTHRRQVQLCRNRFKVRLG